MKKIPVKLKERSYQVIVGAPLENLGGALKSLALGKKALVVTDPKVGSLYFSAVEKSLSVAGFQVSQTVIPAGEKYKAQSSAHKIYRQCIKNGFDRQSTMVALGGGVIGDLAGFAAATFMRGINFAQAPTTLLAQVDASVGGKVGINLPEGKNLVGTFYQPRIVFIDLRTLRTLPEKEFSNGLAEVIKYGVIYDENLFSLLEKNIGKIGLRESAVLEKLIARCCEIKARVVSRDERESNLRAILNFGHTIGHALEGLTAYKKYTHGEAVAIGMVGACKIAERLKLNAESVTDRLRALLKATGLPINIKGQLVVWDRFLEFLKRDKKVLDGKVRFILPTEIGRVKIVEDVPLETIKEVIQSLVGGRG